MSRLLLPSILCLGQILTGGRQCTESQGPNILSTTSAVVICYWETWAGSRSGSGKFEVSNIDPNLCTHLNYAFFGVSQDGGIKSSDSSIDDDLGYISQAIGLKSKNPSLKVLASVGGWGEGSEIFSQMARDTDKRKNFVNSALELLSTHGFDGLDVDWEYPNQRGGIAEDRSNFVTLLRELKEAFAPFGYQLTIAVGAGESTAASSYEIADIAPQVNYINLMTYDFAMGTDGQTGFNAPQSKIEAAVNYWISQGAPATKLVLGIGLYGRTFQLSDPTQHTPGSPSSGPGAQGPYTGEAGYLGYNEICLNNWTPVFDDTNKAPYAYSGDQWVSYDNVQSVEIKLDFALSKNLAGAMVWSIDTDDFRGLCGSAYPLLSAINRKLRG